MMNIKKNMLLALLVAAVANPAFAAELPAVNTENLPTQGTSAKQAQGTSAKQEAPVGVATESYSEKAYNAAASAGTFAQNAFKFVTYSEGRWITVRAAANDKGETPILKAATAGLLYKKAAMISFTAFVVYSACSKFAAMFSSDNEEETEEDEA